MRRVGCLLAFTLVFAGCRHKPPALTAVALPQPVAQVALEPAPATAAAQQVPPVSAGAAPLPAKSVPVRKARPRKKPAVVPAVPPPVQVASIGPAVPAAVVVGALSSGGDNNLALQHKAADLLTTLQKRLTALPAPVLQQQREQIVRIKYFWSQADAALKAGDADGAWNLATKAKVLLDDFSK